MKRMVSLLLVICLFALPLFGCGKDPSGAGNAPSDFSSSESLVQIEWGSFANTSDFQGEFTVYYHDGAKGFTSPAWEGYNTEI